MKKLFLLAGFLASTAATIFPSTSSAAIAVLASAKVEVIASHGPSTYTNWFTLVGVTTAGTCPTINATGQTKVAFAVNVDDRGKVMMNMLQTALLAGKSVVVTYDPAVQVSGLCQAISVQLR